MTVVCQSFCKSINEGARTHAWARPQICVVAAAAASIFRAQKNGFLMIAQ